MFVEDLYLKGFRGIRDGLGRDELSLDLRILPQDARLVALAGPNGKGKTTIMDNLHPYPVMPSRAGKDGLGRFSYYEHLCLPESEKKLQWRHEGRRYRSHLVFRMNGRKKTEAFLHEWIDGRWQPVVLSDGTVADGKMETYARCVIDILGTPEAFFTSQFCAQGRSPLSSYTSSAIKSLLAELLGHAALLRQAGAAGDVARLLKAGLIAVRAALTDMEAEWTSVQQAVRELPSARANEATMRLARDDAQKALLGARDKLSTVKAQESADQSNAARRAEIRRQMGTIDCDWETATGALKAQAESEDARKRALLRRQNERITSAASERRALDNRIGTLQKVLADTSRIRFAVRRSDTASRAFTSREARESDCRARLQRARDLTAAIAAQRTRIASIEREAGRASLSEKDLARRLGLTGEVPCSGTAMQAQCKLLGDAREAKSLLPSAQREIDRLSKDREAAARELREMEVQLTVLGNVTAAFDIAERRRAAAGERLQRLERLAARAQEIERAHTDLDEALRQHEKLGPVSDQPTAEERDELEAIESVQARIVAAHRAADEKRARETANLTRQLAELPAPFDVALVQSAARAVASAQTALEEADRRLTQAVQRVQTLADCASKGQALEAKVAEGRAKVARIEGQIGVWSLLAKALGNDGIVALSIDDAGPTLSALANELLLRCYGPQFTVALHTQVETAKGEAREGFSIVVHDADSGQSKELDNMSGGQRVWINECLTRAIALYLAQQGGRRYETLFSDETDGALDPERKRMFMQMKRAVLEIGGYKREFFISQTPELVGMADAVIDIGSLAEQEEAACES